MSQTHQQPASGASRVSLYDEVTDRIICELEQGRVPWVQPWDASGITLGMPRSAATRKFYSGINILILWDSVIRHGFAAQEWLTFRQALSLGGHVRKGERGTTICFSLKSVKEEVGEVAAPPCAIMEEGDDADAIEASLLENVARRDADPMREYRDRRTRVACSSDQVPGIRALVQPSVALLA